MDIVNIILITIMVVCSIVSAICVIITRYYKKQIDTNMRIIRKNKAEIVEAEKQIKEVVEEIKQPGKPYYMPTPKQYANGMKEVEALNGNNTMDTEMENGDTVIEAVMKPEEGTK